MTTITAEFTPQAWVGDQAIAVDPQGPTKWDAKSDFLALPDEARLVLGDELLAEGAVLDTWDLVREGPSAPGWVRSWSGPFETWIELTP